MTTQSPQSSDEAGSSHELVTALRNAVKLGGSLIITYGIGLAVRFFLPRYLGPEIFGQYSWSDGFTSLFFVVATLGIETYIRKEVSVRPAHATDFYGGIFVLRVGMTVLLALGMAVVMHASHEPEQVRWLVFVFATSQLFVQNNGALSAVLHACGRVDGLSVMNIASKILSGGGLFLMMGLNAPVPFLAVPQLSAEVFETCVLYFLARRHAGLRFRVDFRAVRAVLTTSLPFYVNSAALAANGRTDVTLLGLIASKQEVGWYSGAWTIAGLTMLVTPMIGWVVMPLMSRAAARSEEELTRLIRRAIEATLAFSIPVALAIALGADFWIRLMSGPAFAPAALALRILAPMFVLTYVAMVTSVWLMIVNKAWSVTITSVVGLVLNPALNLLLIKPCLTAIGPSGGAAGSAISMVLTELVVTTILFIRMGRYAFDRRNLVMLGKTLAVCAVVIGMDFFLKPYGPIRLLFEALLYIALVLITRAVRVDEIVSAIRTVRNRSAPQVSPAPATP